MNEITLPRGYDFHAHLRTGDVLTAVLPMTARQFAGAVVMPNLDPPVTTIEAALSYKSEIQSVLKQSPAGHDFTPLMTAYLTDETDPGELIHGFREGVWVAAKLYPANATTNSSRGVTDIRNLAPVFRTMEKNDMPVLIHGELVKLNGFRTDPFDRETSFLKLVLKPLQNEFPRLRIVVEHITTEQAVRYVFGDRSGRLAATVTPHHLWISREDIFEGGLRPYLYCLPPAKHKEHLKALRLAVISVDGQRFFLGTDSAPHLCKRKESECCPGGIFTANAALEYYAEIFDRMGALDERFVAFASENGRQFYGLPKPQGTVTLVRREWKINSPVYVSTEHGFEKIHPFLCDGDGLEDATLHWKMKD